MIRKLSMIPVVFILAAGLLAAMFRFIQPAQAASFIVTNQNDAGPGSLRDAIEAANANPDFDAITFSSALDGQMITLTSGQLKIKSPLEINASSLENSVTISGKYSDRVFYIGSNATLINLIITHGSTLTGSIECPLVCGGGIYVDADNELTLEDSIVKENFAQSGGGISHAGGSAIIINSQIISNTALYDGGGIMTLQPMTITNSLIRGNSSGGYGGGGINVSTQSFTMISSTVAYNKAKGTDADGGGVRLYASNPSRIEKCTIANNSANENGGGIYIYETPQFMLDGSTIRENLANSGGGIHSTHANSTVQNSQIISNTSILEGGGIRAGSAMTITNSAVLGNTSEGYGGGGVALEANERFALVSSTIAYNKAQGPSGFGGGIRVISSETSVIDKSTIANNSASSDGGGIYIQSHVPNLDLQISNSTISTNQNPENGTAVYLEAADSFSIAAQLTNNTLSGNTSGIYIETGGSGTVATTLRNNIIANSTIINCINVIGHASNLSDDASCLGFTQGDPMLGPLTDNGGPTLTHLPSMGSDAIDAGDTSACQNAPVNGLDQRGEARPAEACDTGSVEVEYASNPIPTITSLSPASTQAGGSGFTVTVTGSDFVNGAQVRWNGAARTTTFVSDTQVSAQITAADIANPGTASITVLNPAPGGGLSNTLPFNITPAPDDANKIYLPLVIKNQ